MRTGSITGRTVYLALALPAVGYLLIFFVFPILRLLTQSLFDPHLTLVHFYRVFGEPLYFKILGNTFRTALDVALITLVVGYPIAYLLAFLSEATANVLLILILLPFWTSVLIRSYAWIVLLHRNGVINQALLRLGLISDPLALVYNAIGVHIGLVYVSLPIMILPLYAALRNINPNLVRAAAVLGARPAVTFGRVILPLSLPGVYAGFTLVFVWSLGAFVTPAMLGGMREVLMTGVIDNTIRNTLNWGFAAALSSILIAATLGSMVLLYRFVGAGRIREWR